MKLTREDPLLLELKHQVVGNFFTKKVSTEKIGLGSPIGEKQEGKAPLLISACWRLVTNVTDPTGIVDIPVLQGAGAALAVIPGQKTTPLSVDRGKELIVEAQSPSLHFVSDKRRRSGQGLGKDPGNSRLCNGTL